MCAFEYPQGATVLTMLHFSRDEMLPVSQRCLGLMPAKCKAVPKRYEKKCPFILFFSQNVHN
jgi:hypothetical protein